jgi:hypothetical protein
MKTLFFKTFQTAAEKFIHDAMSRLHTATKADAALGTAGFH